MLSNWVYWFSDKLVNWKLDEKNQPQQQINNNRVKDHKTNNYLFNLSVIVKSFGIPIGFKMGLFSNF